MTPSLSVVIISGAMDISEKWKEAAIRDKVKRQLVADALASDPGPAEQALALGIPCSYCHAPAGRSCVGPRGQRMGGHHNQRQLEALGHEWRTPEQKALARWPVPCPTCAQPEGEECVSKHGLRTGGGHGRRRLARDAFRASLRNGTGVEPTGE